jgi:DUF4097 and DUF4098 domain-containing protein YvlB
MRLLLRSTAVILPVLFLASCDDFMEFGDSERYKEDFHYEYPLAPGGRLSVENQNGSIEITPWDKDAVEINGTKYANTQQAVKSIRIEVSQSPNAVQVRTAVPFGFHNMGARYSIRVPRKVVLDRVVSSNGSIRADGIQGYARLKTSNGSVKLYGHNGEIDAETSNGSIEATDQTGNARLHTSNGAVRIEMNQGSLDAGTSNGSITARLTKPDANAPVRLTSSNGRIDLTMDAVRDVHASTSNSSIQVRIPADANARVRARTSNSSITTEFDVRGERSKHTLEGTIGSGGPMIDLSTSNGGIRLLRL